MYFIVVTAFISILKFMKWNFTLIVVIFINIIDLPMKIMAYVHNLNIESFKKVLFLSK